MSFTMDDVMEENVDPGMYHVGYGSENEVDLIEDVEPIKMPDKIIKTAYMSIEVEEYEEAIKLIKSDIAK